jgi:hypothetical protein
VEMTGHDSNVLDTQHSPLVGGPEVCTGGNCFKDEENTEARSLMQKK